MTMIERTHGDASIRVVLVEPEIPPNTGNVARSCAAVGAGLHLVGPLGFQLEDRHLRRAGLDYWPELEEFIVHDDWDSFTAANTCLPLVLVSSRGEAWHSQHPFPGGDLGLVFGRETAGLASHILRSGWPVVRIPMREGARSLNLANAVAVVLYEVLRQRGFPDLA